jgi:AcrR family transcriptional regulator
MSPRTNQQYEKIRAEKRKAILDAALVVFAEKTFDGSTVSMIAEKAKISKGLIYNYFESKEALLKEIIRNGVQDVWRFFDPNHDGVLTKDEFLYFARKSIQIVKQNPVYWKLYSALMFQPEVIKFLQTDYDELSVRFYQMALDLFKRCHISDPESEMLLFTAMIKGAIIQYVMMPEAYPIDKFEISLENHYKNLLDI